MIPSVARRTVATATMATIVSVATDRFARNIALSNASMRSESFACKRIEPQSLVVHRRLGTQKWIVDLEDSPIVQVQPIDLLLLVFEEDAIISAILDHRHHPLARPIG